MDIFRKSMKAIILLSASHLCHGTFDSCDSTALIDPDFGFVDVYTDDFLGTIAEYQCFDGYRLVGNEWRECLHDGSWSGQAPWCEEANCDPDALGTLNNGHIEVGYADEQSDCPVETSAFHVCDQGYYLSSGDEERVCINDVRGRAVWDGTMPVCLEIPTCDGSVLGDPKNGQILFPSIADVRAAPAGTRVRYVCDAPHVLDGNAGSPYRTCESSGEWSGKAPVCTEPPQVASGSWSAWEVTSSCSETCGGGVRQERRRCSNPPPSRGGSTCAGESERSAPCNRNQCEGVTTLSSQGNPKGENPTTRRGNEGGSNIIPIIAGTVAGIVLLLAAIVTAICLARRRRGIERQLQRPQPNTHAKKHVDISTVYGVGDSPQINNVRRGNILPAKHDYLDHSKETTDKQINSPSTGRSSHKMTNQTRHLRRVLSDSSSPKVIKDPKNSRREATDVKVISDRSSPKVIKAAKNGAKDTENRSASNVSKRSQDNSAFKKKSRTDKSIRSPPKTDRPTNKNPLGDSPGPSIKKPETQHLQADRKTARPNVYSKLPDHRETYEDLSGRPNRNHDHKYRQLVNRDHNSPSLHKKDNGSNDSRISRQHVMTPAGSDYSYIHGSGSSHGSSARTMSSQGSESYDYIGGTTYMEVMSDDIRSRVSGPALPTRPS